MTVQLERDRWVCPNCEGTGYVLDSNEEAVACDCLETRVRRARSSGVSSVIPRRYRGVSFDRSPVPELEASIVREVRRFVADIDGRLAQGSGLWFMGDVGTGKTTLAMLVSKAALNSGHSVAIYSVPRLLAEIRDTYDADSGERSYMEFFRRLVKVDLLHLEDLGTEKRTDWVLEQLYSLVNQRYEDKRSVIVTTNVETPDELETQIGKRTVSRLVEICGDPLRLFGPDRRIAYDPARTALG
jgi:DNA replication protein DnaC